MLGNVHYSQERDALLLVDEVELYEYAAYSSDQTREEFAKLGSEG
ncbi:MAG: hypothetical protein QS721_15005 [Candidatus Endonucleobacter sp. (ex Gigantidas childressi)]|nr:hypothetical protein [Candidatus Endonucleobacter sp. (ex Gigantidas childressi)]